MAIESPACILCRRLWYDNEQGLFVVGHYICAECEARIITLTCDDPDYEHYKWGLKKIWHRPGA